MNKAQIIYLILSVSIGVHPWFEIFGAQNLTRKYEKNLAAIDDYIISILL